jgi:hypothetical protein
MTAGPGGATLVGRGGDPSLRLVLVVLAACALAVAAAAREAAPPVVVPVGWREVHTGFGKHLVFHYRVETLTLGRGRWQARVWLRNDTNLRIALHRNFALLAEPHGGGPRLVFRASAFSPDPPRVLGFLAAWRGEVAGRGVPPHGTSLRLRFGTMSAVILPNHRITHVTRHAHRW